jgi:hypothetical protein
VKFEFKLELGPQFTAVVRVLILITDNASDLFISKIGPFVHLTVLEEAGHKPG